MTAHETEFFTWDEVNRLKILQDVIVRNLPYSLTSCNVGAIAITS